MKENVMKYSINNITLKGQIISTPQITHEVLGEQFYAFDLEVKRYNGVSDIIPIVVSAIIFKDINENDFVEIKGDIRTYNVYEEENKRLYVRVFTKSITKVEEEDYLNEVELQGAIIKSSLRKTFKGKDICDITLGVDRSYKRTDYIPVIVWNRQACLINTFDIYSYINVKGRLQSRTYQKKNQEGEVLFERTVVELSVNELSQVELQEVEE